MSGIFAYIGREEPVGALLKGLGALQHRGGEVNGITVKVKDGFSSARTVGDMSRLGEECGRITAQGCCGIAETSVQSRAVGAASLVPAANHLFAVACDGSIHNYHSLKRWSREPFAVNTDEDLLLACLSISSVKECPQLAVKAAAALSGAPGFAFMSANESAVYAHAGNSPLFVGTGEGGCYLSSELAPLLAVCEKYTLLEKGETARLRTDRALFYDAKCKKVKKSFSPIPDRVYFENEYRPDEELYACSLAAREVYTKFVRDARLTFDGLKLSRRSVEKLSRIILVGEGSSYAAALYGRNLLDMVTDIPSFAFRSGEFMFARGVMDDDTLLIAVSFRGETGATLACVRRAKAAGAKTLALTSSNISSLSMMCDYAVTFEGDFVRGVALRPFISCTLTLALLSLYIGGKNGVVTDLYLSVALKMAELLAGKIASAIKDNTAFAGAVNILKNAKNLYACGIGADYAASIEAADKMRALCGIDCAAVPLTELAQYPTVGEGTVILAFVTGKTTAGASEAFLSRMKTRGARVILFTTDSIGEEMNAFDAVLSVNDTMPLFDALPCVAASFRLSLLLADAQQSDEKNEPVAS